MGKVTYDQAGYCGSSMSERAREAYESGEMPKSKWTKAVMVAALQEWCEENDRALNDDVEKMRKDDIWSRFFKWKSWHHTGKFANETDFYGIDEDAAEEASHPMTEAEDALRCARESLRIAQGEAEHWAILATEAASDVKRAEERVRFERENECSFYSLAGYVARGRTSFRIARSGALMIACCGNEYNLSTYSGIDSFIYAAFGWHFVHGEPELCERTRQTIAAEAEAMRAQLAEQAAA